ncbi:MAG: helix-turn-helix transcriptional regulator [Bacilli bacterium]|nr:helix-turn-helix transcriptional regulator [Bacilli bacterium]
MSKENIGPKIKQFRKKRKLTQEELAESLGHRMGILGCSTAEMKMSLDC